MKIFILLPSSLESRSLESQMETLESWISQQFSYTAYIITVLFLWLLLLLLWMSAHPQIFLHREKIMKTIRIVLKLMSLSLFPSSSSSSSLVYDWRELRSGEQRMEDGGWRIEIVKTIFLQRGSNSFNPFFVTQSV